MTTALAIAVAAAVVGAATVIVVAYRRRAARERAVNEAPAGGSSRVQDELRRTQFELRRARQLAALTETLDLDELLGRVLQSATLTVDADAAAVALWQEGEAPIAKAMNLTADEAVPLLGNFQQESRPLRALTVRYRFPSEGNSASGVQLGVLLPLASEDSSL